MLEVCHVDYPLAFWRNIFSIINLKLLYKIKSLGHGLRGGQVSEKTSSSGGIRLQHRQEINLQKPLQWPDFQNGRKPTVLSDFSNAFLDAYLGKQHQAHAKAQWEQSVFNLTWRKHLYCCILYWSKVTVPSKLWMLWQFMEDNKLAWSIFLLEINL